MRITLIFGAVFALLGSASVAETIVFDAGIEIENSGVREMLDVNQDGYDDVLFSISSFSGDASAEALIDFDLPAIRRLHDPFDFDFGTSFQTFVSSTSFILDNNGDVKLFNPGDLVSMGAGGSTFEKLFGGSDSSGIIPDVGDSAWVGVQIETGMGSVNSGDGFFFEGFVSDTNITYGFFNVIHGSIDVTTTGYNNVIGAPAQIPGTTVPPVPLPASAWFMIAGVAGLAATRRKRA